jgi:hypothetical protein
MTIVMNKSIYHYYNVPEKLFWGFVKNESSGRFFNEFIRDKYNWEKSE